MSNLLNKLATIYTPKVPALTTGYACTIDDFWNSFILPKLPDPSVVLAWHKVLIEYVNAPDAVFAIRYYNNAPKDRYDDLRRGFLSKTNQNYSFFYTDNFHAAYFAKMASDGFAPTKKELLDAYLNRQFPSRFGRDTANERSMMAVPKGPDPGIQTAGYKLAHIINVGTDYYINGKAYTLSKLIEAYYPRGLRTDWKLHTDATGTYYLRDFSPIPEARKILVAEYLRFVHPFNYFLTPKSTCSQTPMCKDIAEYQPLVDFVREKIAAIYGELYEEYLDLIMVDKSSFAHSNGQHVINLKYGHNLKSSQAVSSAQPTGASTHSAPHQSSIALQPVHSASTPKKLEIQIVKEYLSNPATSFRKLERQFLGIDSQARGGGFIAKTIVNSYGVTAQDKGLLSHTSLDIAIANSSGKLKQALCLIKGD